jgi:gamma-glutamylcysteine synthetase
MRGRNTLPWFVSCALLLFPLQLLTEEQKVHCFAKRLQKNERERLRKLEKKLEGDKVRAERDHLQVTKEDLQARNSVLMNVLVAQSSALGDRVSVSSKCPMNHPHNGFHVCSLPHPMPTTL